MKVLHTEPLAHNTAALTVAVSAEEFASAVKQAYRKEKDRYEVAGYAKGEAPQQAIEQAYGEDIFYEAAARFAVSAVYSDAVNQAGLEPVCYPSIQVQSIGRDGMCFRAVVAVYPEVTLGRYKGLRAEKTVEPVTENEVEDELHKAAVQAARTETVDRPAQMGDIALIDYEGFVQGVPFDGGKDTQYPLTLGSGTFIPGFEEQLLGQCAGAQTVVSVHFPQDYHVEELAGAAAEFQVKVHAVQQKNVPPVDDTLAREAGGVDSLQAWKQVIREKLAAQKEEAARLTVENALIDQVIAGMTCDIPQQMVDARIDEMLHSFETNLGLQGLTLAQYFNYTGQTEQTLRREMAEDALHGVKNTLAIDAVIRAEQIAALPEEVEEVYRAMARSYDVPVEKVKQLMPDTAALEQDIKRQKAVELIVSAALITDKP